MCAWIEANFGSSSLRLAGSEIGKRAYDQMLADPTMESAPDPLDMMRRLVNVAGEMIQNPQKRGWEILETGSGLIIMRRTQTFNCVLQEGLLQSLVQLCGVKLVSAQHVGCQRDGAEFCDDRVTWHA